MRCQMIIYSGPDNWLTTAKTNTMSEQKQFGVWMDTHQATIVGKENTESGNLVIIAHTDGQVVTHNSSEKNENNEKRALSTKFFKEIATHLQNATHLHVTGTGQAQEQFIHYLAETPQFKNVKTEESTSNKMSDEKLLAFFVDKLN
jgi:stalled ribosome rescue protein Dom34